MVQLMRGRGVLAAGRPVRARVLAGIAPVLFVPALLVLLLPLSLGSVLGAVAALLLVVMLTVLFALGTERTGFLLLLLAFVLAPMNDVKPVAAISFVTASDVFLFLGVAALSPVLVTRGFGRQAPFLIGVVGLVGVGLLTSAASPEPAASLNGLTRLVVGALTLPIVFMVWRPGRRVLVAFAWAYVIGVCISTAQGRITGLVSVDGRYVGLTEHPNILGLTSLLGLTLVPFLLYETPGRHRLIPLVAGALCAYGIWMSGSRAALIGAVAVVLLYLLVSRSIEHALLLFGLSIVPFYVVARAFSSSADDSSPLGRLRGGGSASLSDLDRENLAKVALDRFTDHPLIGAGFADAAEAHNIYLQVAGAGGVIALVLYLLIMVSAIRQPLLLGAHLRLLALPVMGYLLVGPLTPLLWDRYIWCVIALPFLVPRPGERGTGGPGSASRAVTSWTSGSFSHHGHPPAADIPGD
ncbi:MAG: O-antigen ligase family protein [Aeromicrobium sp.]